MKLPGSPMYLLWHFAWKIRTTDFWKKLDGGGTVKAAHGSTEKETKRKSEKYEDKKCDQIKNITSVSSCPVSDHNYNCSCG